MKPHTYNKVRSEDESSRRGPTKAPMGHVRRRNIPRALLVLGMHRSGTSALARVFSLLGAKLPRNLVGANPTNEAGHWESLDLMLSHDELLATAGSQWDDWRIFNSDWIHSGVAEDYRQKLLGILKNDFNGSPLFLVKDPRICRFVPFWLEVLEGFGAKTCIVISVRNPLEVAASLKRRDGFPSAKSYLLWLRHVLDAERATRQLPRAVVAYEDLLNDWRSLVEKVGVRTGICWPRRSDRSDLEIDQFLVDSLRHHQADHSELTARSDIVDWVREAYRILRQMASNRETKDHFKQLDRIHSEFEKACGTFGFVLAAEEERSASQLRTVEKLIKTRDEEIGRLSGDLSDVRRAAHEAKAEAVASQSQIAALGADLEAARIVVRKHEIALADSERKIADRERQRDQLSFALEEARTTAARNGGLVDILRQEIEKFRLDRDNETEAVKLKADLETAQSISNDRKSENDKLSCELKSARSVIQDRDGEIDRLSRDLDAMRLFLRESQSETQRIAGELDSARAEIKGFGVERHRILELLQAESARTASEIRRIEKSAADSTAALEALHAATLAETRSQAQAQIRSLRDQFVDADAALARDRARKRRSWTGFFSPSKRRVAQHLIESGLFETEWYLREYPDVVKSGRYPADHYLEEGYLSGHRPNPLFDSRWYLERYEDVRRSGVNPLVHYLRNGYREGRNPSSEFETDFYLLSYPDVRTSGMNPLTHYLRVGKTEGRLAMKPRAVSRIRDSASDLIASTRLD